MLQIQLDVVMADMQVKVAVKVDELVSGTEEELTSMTLMFWT
jgi:hypothetical protein